MPHSLFVSLIAAATVFFLPPPAAAQPDPSLDPTFGSVSLKAGFKPDPYKKDVSAGGSISSALGGVNGNISKAPEFRLDYTAGTAPLIFEVSSKGETTLLIRTPDGKWVANGDGLRGQIVFENPQSGRYDIYVGTVGKNTLPAAIIIAEAPLAPLIGKGNLPDCHILCAGVDFFVTQNNLRGCQNDARDITAAFRTQAGTVYRKVDHETLLDKAATRANILEGFQKFADRGNAGDFFVLSLSGHGGIDGSYWFFTPFNYSGSNKLDTSLTDEQLFSASAKLMMQKKNVVIIADACHSGKLISNAKTYFERHKDALENGGLVLIVACDEKQEATNIGENGALSKAFVESMSLAGDLDKDGKITLGEIRDSSTKRVSAMVEKVNHKQTSDIVWFGKIDEKTTMVVAKPLTQVAKAFDAPKLPRGFGNPKWDVSGLESRFSILRCHVDPTNTSNLIFVLDLKEDIAMVPKYTLVLSDSDGIKTKLTGSTDLIVGKRGGRFVLKFAGSLSVLEKEKWAKAVEVKFEVE